MGKAGRIACIFTPWALTIASFVCLIMIEISGWGGKTGSLNQYYFMQANFTNFSTASAGDLANSTTLTAALDLAHQNHQLQGLYQIHLWNYCSSNSEDEKIDYCSPKQKEYYFDPVAAWGLNGTNATSSSNSEGTNLFTSEVSNLKNNTEELENKLLGKTGKEALDAYRHVAKFMFIAYEVSFWTTLATIVCGLLAIFSRWGSFLTWLFSIVSSLFTFAAVLTSTILFSALAGALQTILHPYGIKLSVGTHALALTWIAVAFSVGATLFWLFSVCCCSGRSNPHHRSNKGGLWNAEPAQGGYGGRGRGMRVEKKGGGYERVSSPFLGGERGDRVPLNQYPAQQGHYRQPSGAYEPFRHT